MTAPSADPRPTPVAAPVAAPARALASVAADTLLRATGYDAFDVAVVLGSGWAATADLLGAPDADLAAAHLPGFAQPTVTGHAGRVRALTVGDRRVLVVLGRPHLYEGHDADTVVHPVRTAAAAGCRVVVLTNGCGGLRPEWAPGTPVLIADQLNLTGVSPLQGATFVDLTDLYSPRLRALCLRLDPTLDEGVYAQLRGPQYETPAEIRMLRTLGADLVAMSTAVEAIAAREVGLEVLGVSLVTNPAAGVGGAPLSHDEVLAAGRDAAPRLGALLRGVAVDA